MSRARSVAGSPLSLIALGVAALLLVFVPEVAFARGGGGGHGGGGGFGGGGFGGGGYSGGWGSSTGSDYYGGGGGSGVGLLGLGFLGSALFGGGPFFIILLILGILSALRRGSGGFPIGGGGASWPQPAPMGWGGGTIGPTASPDDGLASIKQADPNFSVDVFLQRVQASFFALEQAWQDRNIDEARAYMSDGLYSSWSAQIAQMISLHKKNILENLNIQGMVIAKVVHDAQVDAITVRIDAVCADYEINEDTGKTTFGDKKDRPFTEYWTFVRAAGTKTVASGGVTAKVCPNCGAPLSVNPSGHCTYCNALVTSGSFDWVLSKIDQVSEWQG